MGRRRQGGSLEWGAWALSAALLAATLSASSSEGQRPLSDAEPSLPPGALRLQLDPVIWIEAGSFAMGEDEADRAYAHRLCEPLGADAGGAFCVAEVERSRLMRRRITTRRYGIDRMEVTRGAYRRCVLRGECSPTHFQSADPRFGDDRHPVVGVDWAQAQRYCESRSGRLPTEAEWERAARGDGRHRFPWGRFYDPTLANHGRKVGSTAVGAGPGVIVLPEAGPDARDGHAYLSPVGAYPLGASPHGLLDMAGNASEWTWDAPGEGGGSSVDPRIRDGSDRRIVRGGSWRSLPHHLRSTHRQPMPMHAANPELGFRCAYDPRARLVEPRRAGVGARGGALAMGPPRRYGSADSSPESKRRDPPFRLDTMQ